MCKIWKKEQIVASERKMCVTGIKRAVQKMLESTKQKLKDLQVCDRVPKIYLDPKNVLRVC